MPKCPSYSRAGDTYCGCGRMVQGITDEVGNQTEQRIGSRFIMYVPGISDLASKIPLIREARCLYHWLDVGIQGRRSPPVLSYLR